MITVLAESMDESVVETEGLPDLSLCSSALKNAYIIQKPAYYLEQHSQKLISTLQAF